MLELQQICLRYQDQQDYLLKELSLRFSPGTLSVLTGCNGCGKTSVLNIICGVIPTHSSADFSGQVLYNKEDITRLPLNERARILSIQMADPDTQFFFPSLAHELSFPLENMGLAPAEIQRRITATSDFFSLAEFLDLDAATCSCGQQKLLLWAICDLIDAPLILLDEPCSGISPAKLQQLFAWIEILIQRGKIVIAAEHDPRLISRADQIISLDQLRGLNNEL